MKAQDLPEQYKKYTLSLTDKTKYTLTGQQKDSILRSNSQFVQLENGSIINKAHIIAFHFEKQETIESFQALPDAEKAVVTSQITHESH